MLVGDLVVRVLAQPLAALDVGVDGAALDRPGADDRHLDREVLEVLGPRAPQRLHLRAALDLEDARRVGRPGCTRRSPGRRRGSARGRSARRASRAISSTQRSTAESIPSPSRSIFRNPASEQESLSHWTIWRPSIAAGHDRAAVDQRAGRDDHPARVLGEVARQPVGLGRQPRQPGPAAARPRSAPARRARPERALDVPPPSRASQPSLPRATRSISPGGRPERLAELADRAARAVGRERGDQRRAIVPVALVDARDQHLADVAREVEVDVRQRGQLLVEEAPDQQLVGDRVDVREAGQVADDRGDARSRGRARAAAARGRCRARGPRPRPRAPARACRGAAGRSRAGRAAR